MNFINHWFYGCNRNASQSDFCGILLNFKADFCITISNNFKMVPDQIKSVTPPCISKGSKLYLV